MNVYNNKTIWAPMEKHFAEVWCNLTSENTERMLHKLASVRYSTK